MIHVNVAGLESAHSDLSLGCAAVPPAEMSRVTQSVYTTLIFPAVLWNFYTIFAHILSLHSLSDTTI